MTAHSVRPRMLLKLVEWIAIVMHRLRKLRNRVHIQFDDDPKDLPRDDPEAFN